ncbi:hypothetical protein [Mesorhizobium sp. CAU 1732]|uniref:hypothetical protein n=1 Tax=Mesorhizobium sp. CAU 1732 TaxID=3140358 RepID=UPI003260C09E
MNPADPKRRVELDEEAPSIEQVDWDDVDAGEPDGDVPPEIAELDGEEEQSGDLPEEDDDNPYQNSDEALPDDLDERVISRDPSKEGGRFDEI